MHNTVYIRILNKRQINANKMSDATRKAEIGPNSSTILSEQRVMQRITEANGAVYGKYFSALGLCDMMIYIYIYI